MRKTDRNELESNLIQAVKDAGQDLIDNAEDIVGKTNLVSSMAITIRFDPEVNMLIPLVNVEKERLCRNAYERYICNSKGEKTGWQRSVKV